MRTMVAAGLMVLVVAAGMVGASEEIDREMLPVLEKAKSRDAAERAAAVRELVGLREAVSDTLKAIVADANEGRAPEISKASALYIMGELRLLQCVDVLEREKEWTYRIVGKTREENLLLSVTSDRDWPVKSTVVARLARGIVGSGGGGVRLAGGTEKANLADYPALAAALAGLRAEYYKDVEAADKAVRRWHEVVCRSMKTVFKPLSGGLYSDDVKVTACYVVGEYRAYASNDLRKNIDLKDEKGLCAGYSSALVVEGVDSAYPCAVALVKTGCKGGAGAEIFDFLGYDSISQEGRERMARVYMLIDPEATKAGYEEALARIRDMADEFMGDAAGHREKLESVSGIIN